MKIILLFVTVMLYSSLDWPFSFARRVLLLNRNS